MPETITELLDDAAARFPDEVAINVFDRAEKLTYGELRSAVARFADGLDGMGVKRGDHVAVMLSNRIEFPITWLSLARLGAVMVPIVLSSSSREIEFFISDSEASFIIVEVGLFEERGIEVGVGAIPPADRIVTVGAAGPRSYEALTASGRAQFQPPYRPLRDDLLNIQYTSGTTGLPKGVMLSHRYWIICGASGQTFFDLPFRSILADAPFYYMDSQWMLVAALLCGGRLDLAERPSITKYVDRLHQQRSQVAWLTEQVLKDPPQDKERSTDIRLFLGYNQSPSTVRLAEERFGAPVRELYGSTEAGGVLGVPLHVEDVEIIGTCGVPYPHREVRIVRSDGMDCADGEVGELWVKGDGIMSGYWRRPEANAELLVDSWFRTGDLFVRSAKGFYSIVGRLKDMVRRSGENIASIEVEQVLMDMAEIAFAAVVAVPDDDREEEAKAYVQLADGVACPSYDAMLAHCRARLAPFKVPRYWAFVDEFPFTPSEKIAKRELTAGVTDLRVGAWDAQDNVQR